MLSADRLLTIQRETERKLGVYTLTGEYEIVYCLLDAECMAPKELQTHCRLSPTAFYHTLKRMEQRGFVEAQVNPADRRGLLYRLSGPMRDLVIAQHKGYRDQAMANYRYKEPGAHRLDDYRGYIHKSDSVTHLTGDFQILLYLYLKSGISNLQISDVVDVSQTKFNQSLKKLWEMGLVEYKKDPDDHRSKHYSVTEGVREALDDLHRRVFRWIEAESSA